MRYTQYLKYDQKTIFIFRENKINFENYQISERGSGDGFQDIDVIVQSVSSTFCSSDTLCGSWGNCKLNESEQLKKTYQNGIIEIDFIVWKMKCAVHLL